MAVHKSSKYCTKQIQNAVAASPSAVFTTMQLRVFTGSGPATADAAETGTLLLVVTEPSYAALSWGTAVAGVLAKSANVWAGVAGDTNAGTGSSATTKITTGSGTAGYMRIVSKADDGSNDASAKVWPRLQGLVGETGGLELVLSSAIIAFGASITVDSASMTIAPN